MSELKEPPTLMQRLAEPRKEKIDWDNPYLTDKDGTRYRANPDWKEYGDPLLVKVDEKSHNE